MITIDVCVCVCLCVCVCNRDIYIERKGKYQKLDIEKAKDTERNLEQDKKRKKESN